MTTTDPIHDAVNAVYRRPFPPRARDADSPARRLRRRRGSAARRVSGGARAMADATACRRTRAPGWCRPDGSRRSTACAGARGSMRSTTWAARRPTSRVIDAAAWADAESVEDDRLAPDLHLLPSGARARRAGGAHAARSLRPDDRGDRAGVPDAGADAGAAHRPREGEDSRRAHSLSGADAGRAARAARRRAARDLSRLQRRIRGVVRRGVDAARSVGRSDPARAAARRAAAGAGSARPARADAAARIAARGADVADAAS